MARLVGIPNTVEELISEYKRLTAPHVRLGQYAWNVYGVAGVDGKTDSELFYASNEDAIRILKEKYYS